MDNVVNVSLVGVGGQGILLTSEVLARAAAIAGLDVKKSEVHGMAQRGGSVISQVRFGPRVYSPIIPDGGTDILVAFERLEALRWRHLLAPDGRVLINHHDLMPITVSSGQQPAPEDLDGLVNRLYPKAIMVAATRLATELGQVRAANMVLAGALSRWTPFGVEAWQEAMRARIPARLLALNERAFAAGRATQP
jgi:indolepyruvate ferredoxin oxidoreductase, beta subunit